LPGRLYPVQEKGVCGIAAPALIKSLRDFMKGGFAATKKEKKLENA
jgi:hypothetical protein